MNEFMQDLSGILMDIHVNPDGKTAAQITQTITNFYNSWQIIEVQEEFSWDGNLPAPSAPDYTIYGYVKKIGG